MCTQCELNWIVLVWGHLIGNSRSSYKTTQLRKVPTCTPWAITSRVHPASAMQHKILAAMLVFSLSEKKKNTLSAPLYFYDKYQAASTRFVKLIHDHAWGSLLHGLQCNLWCCMFDAQRDCRAVEHLCKTENKSTFEESDDGTPR